MEKNQFTAKVLSSVVPDDDVPRDIDSERGTDDEKTSDEISNPDFENGELFSFCAKLLQLVTVKALLSPSLLSSPLY